ncbi:hypothetical protein B7494_g7428 [Chlorociboria aeruginascens]|nr:hypothetical protein B7494_g7428 [Chlorociboria aeruginascens]
MNQTHSPAGVIPPGPDAAGYPAAPLNPQTLLLDAFFPGFSLLSTALYKYSAIDLTLYFPTFLVLGAVVFASNYIQAWFWEKLDSYFMAKADIRIDDEMYNMLMAWVSTQKFATNARRFVANTNLNSRMWYLFRAWDDDDDDDDDEIEFDEEGNPITKHDAGKKQKMVQFTPSFGTHYFWYKKKLLCFQRSEDTRQNGWGSISQREQIAISSLGRSPMILKELLEECRTNFQKSDENKTIIYRGAVKSGSTEPSWTRCVSRVSRPFSTIVLEEKVKVDLLKDMKEYLHPYTRRWYSNRGIPYRRGYLLYGPPGTGKSSLSFAIAGYFKLKIYIVSLNSLSMNEENLGTLFAELPRQCVVLLEDIDTAGLTHARGQPAPALEVTPTAPKTPQSPPGTVVSATQNTGGRISLSALLNVLDGVASQEGRVLIMTTNHLEKLDEALIRPGRVDMMVKFTLATTEMMITIFRAIYATLEGDIPPSKKRPVAITAPGEKKLSVAEKAAALQKAEDEEKVKLKEAEEKKASEEKRIGEMAIRFSKEIPTLTFSPAEIQGYLLKHKRDPEAAIEGAKEWTRITSAEKKKEREKREEEERMRLLNEEKEKKAREEQEAKEKAENEKGEKGETKESEVNGDNEEEKAKTEIATVVVKDSPNTTPALGELKINTATDNIPAPIIVNGDSISDTKNKTNAEIDSAIAINGVNGVEHADGEKAQEGKVNGVDSAVDVGVNGNGVNGEHI